MPDPCYRPSSEEINAMPQAHYKGEVTVIRSLKQWHKAAPELRKDAILGFDTETRPTFRKGKLNEPALIQLATASHVYLIQLGCLPFGKEIAEIMASPDIIKVGVGIAADMGALAKIHPFQPDGLIDLGEMASSHKLPNHGLRTLAASLFGWRISKGCQCSNWSASNLSPRQIAYAATDAWIGRMIYLRLRELGYDYTPGRLSLPGENVPNSPFRKRPECPDHV